MPVVCATNLSESSSRAARAAAAIASRLREPLWLLGVLDGDHPIPEGPASLEEARERLRAEAARLRTADLPVETRLLEHSPGGALLNDELAQHARLLVVAANGWGSVSPWRRAPLHERLAQHSQVPVLVVRRNADSLADWAQGRRRLLVLVGVDDSRTSAAAVAWLRELRHIGPCDVVATRVCSPVEERERLGIHTPVHLELLDPVVRRIEVLDPQVERVLLRELAELVGELPGEGKLEPHLEPGFGRLSDHLLHAAHTRGVDLVVVGTHQRGGLSRLWHGSVSAGVLRHAEQSVTCVPPTQPVVRKTVPPRAVLVPIDFSEACTRAISEARALVRPGGRVHLLHVHRLRSSERAWVLDQYGVVPEPPREQRLVMERLKALVPHEEGAQQVQWTMEGVTGEDVARAICQATEREGVDLVCLGTSRARTHAGYLSDAVARALVERCRRPVVVLHA
ncbi:universal stress protein [Vitiosangium sp. GDMCC 1.1324]|uniref:universal stress protein n=1 Tax=Vitiosangium sp. (strain GDMCC 1.1324) TaxID=2138576 RepID=UPI000D36D389|nr:universal stress protein [Vitiosangium sp. GDMCC 1.1324]PTL79623.1 universal stress protein [Vitiosangium sp. GDMCC 1.1324]